MDLFSASLRKQRLHRGTTGETRASDKVPATDMVDIRLLEPAFLLTFRSSNHMNLTPQGLQFIADIASRHGVSVDAVSTMLQAVINGGGTMAQFSHPEFGGTGQWIAEGVATFGLLALVLLVLLREEARQVIAAAQLPANEAAAELLAHHSDASAEALMRSRPRTCCWRAPAAWRASSASSTSWRQRGRASRPAARRSARSSSWRTRPPRSCPRATSSTTPASRASCAPRGTASCRPSCWRWC